MITVKFDATLLLCWACNAPMVSPFPPGWTFTVRMYDGKRYGTPHVADCEQPPADLDPLMVRVCTLEGHFDGDH